MNPADVGLKRILLFDLLDVMEGRHDELSDDRLIFLLAHFTVTMCHHRGIESRAVTAVIDTWGEQEN